MCGERRPARPLETRLDGQATITTTDDGARSPFTRQFTARLPVNGHRTKNTYRR
jgi:hypothetical protein